MRTSNREFHVSHVSLTSGVSRTRPPQAGERGVSMLFKNSGWMLGAAVSVAIGLASSGAASAANVTFSYNLFSAGTPNSGMAGDSSLIPFNQTDGLAVYFPGSGSSPNITVANGDTFIPVTVTGSSLSASNATSGLSFAASSYANGAGTNAAGTQGNLSHHYGGYFSANGSTAVTLTTGDPLFDSVFTAGGNYDGNTGDAAAITLGGLTVGQTYQFEVYVIDSRTSQQNHNGIGGGRSMLLYNGNESDIASGAYSTTADFPTSTQYQYAYGWGTSGLNGNGSGTAGTTNYIGMAITGVFTADATTQTFNEQQFNTDSSPLAIQGSQFNAFLLTPEVPEPAPIAMLGIAGASLLLLRRRISA
jgi:hypothetical protein